MRRRPPSSRSDPGFSIKKNLFVQKPSDHAGQHQAGKFRMRTLKGVLWIINRLAKTSFIKGNLGGIPTIHFARWLLIDDDRRLLFFSNYDGSLGDLLISRRFVAVDISSWNYEADFGYCEYTAYCCLPTPLDSDFSRRARYQVQAESAGIVPCLTYPSDVVKSSRRDPTASRNRPTNQARRNCRRSC